MSALTTCKKFALTTAAVTVALMLSSCTESGEGQADSSMMTNTRTHVNCYNDETNELQAHDDVLTHTLSSGSCGTSLEAEIEEAERQRIRAEPRKERALALVAHQEAIAAKIHGLTDSSAILGEVVTYSCQAAPESDDVDTLVEAAELVYDSHWHANAAELWPYRYADALERFGCWRMIDLKEYWYG